MTTPTPETDALTLVTEVVASHLRDCTICKITPTGEHIARNVLQVLGIEMSNA